MAITTSTTRIDPTRTAMVRKTIRLFLTGLYKKFSNLIHDTLVSEDALSTQPVTTTAFSIFYPWRFLPPVERLKAFVGWFDIEARNQIVLPWQGLLEKKIYSVVLSGIVDGYDQLKRSDKHPVPTTEMEMGVSLAGKTSSTLSIINKEESRNALALLKERSLSDLNGILEVTSTQLYRSIMDGVSMGENKEELFVRVSKKIEEIAVPRSMMMGESEVIRWFTTGQLMMFSTSNITNVKTIPEVSRGNVCTTCTRIGIKDIKSAWNLLPAHVGCRCKWVLA